MTNAGTPGWSAGTVETGEGASYTAFGRLTTTNPSTPFRIATGIVLTGVSDKAGNETTFTFTDVSTTFTQVPATEQDQYRLSTATFSKLTEVTSKWETFRLLSLDDGKENELQQTGVVSVESEYYKTN